MDGEDRLREQYDENGTIYVLKFVNGRTTIYTPSNTTATIISGKEPLQDSRNYLMSLGFPISGEQRAASSSFFPEALRNESFGWKLDSNYWLVDENECFKLTNNRGQEFLVDPKVEYSVRWKKNDSTINVSFSEFRTIDGKWLPFQIEISGSVNSKLSVESLGFGGRKSLDKKFPPGTMINNTIDNALYYLDANGNRQNLAGAIEEAKGVLPNPTSNHWGIGIGIIAVLTGVAIEVLKRRKTGQN